MGERRNLTNAYYDWMLYRVTPERGSIRPYSRLLSYLNNVDFRYILPRDGNRYDDGVSLRYRYGNECGVPHSEIASTLDTHPCSVLEMMVALAWRCEEEIMSNPEFGDRTSVWFWEFIESLGLNEMTDNHFDERYVSQVLDNFMDRNYDYDGRGGLVTVEDPDTDMRDLEIWYQMMRYLNKYKEEYSLC